MNCFVAQAHIALMSGRSPEIFLMMQGSERGEPKRDLFFLLGYTPAGSGRSPQGSETPASAAQSDKDLALVLAVAHPLERTVQIGIKKSRF